jgi:ABC-type arginine transport system permease subunit
LRVIPVFTCVLFVYYGIAILLTSGARLIEHKVSYWRPQTEGIR